MDLKSDNKNDDDNNQSCWSSALFPKGETISTSDKKNTKYALVVQLAAGLAFGFMIGFVGCLFFAVEDVTDCTRFRTADSCAAVTFAGGCSWANNSCLFSDKVNCSMASKEACSGWGGGGGGSCLWHHHKGQCEHVQGWDASQRGLIGGIQVIGSVIASVATGSLADRIGRRPALGIAAVFGLIASAFFSAGWAQGGNFWLLFCGELCIGVMAGAMAVIGPLFCELISNPKLQQVIGLTFQVASAFGSAFAAIIAIAVHSQLDVAVAGASWQSGFHCVIAGSWLTCLLLMPTALWVPEPSKSSSSEQQQQPEPQTKEHHQETLIDGKEAPLLVVSDSPPREFDDAQSAEVDSSSSSSSMTALCRKELMLPLACATVLGIVFPLTGINATMFFGPLLLGKIGFSPVLANVVIQLSNFVFSIPPIFLVRRFSTRVLFLLGTAIVSIACTVSAVSLYPGVMERSSAAQKVVVLSSIIVFLLGFGFLATSFFSLAQDVWPTPVRSVGTSFTIWICMLATLTLNFGYPNFVVAASGGAGGDQDLGAAAGYSCFAGIGTFGFIFLWCLMPKTQSEEQHEAKQQRQQQLPLPKISVLDMEELIEATTSKGPSADSSMECLDVFNHPDTTF